MSMQCTRCEGSGFLNTEQISEEKLVQFYDSDDFNDAVLDWIKNNKNHDVSVCDCCGDGEDWYGVAGEHYNSEDPQGKNGPYASNGGLCHCH